MLSQRAIVSAVSGDRSRGKPFFRQEGTDVASSVMRQLAILDMGDGDTPNYVSDATITFIGGAGFIESGVSGVPSGADTLGVDLPSNSSR